MDKAAQISTEAVPLLLRIQAILEMLFKRLSNVCRYLFLSFNQLIPSRSIRCELNSIHLFLSFPIARKRLLFYSLQMNNNNYNKQNKLYKDILPSISLKWKHQQRFILSQQRYAPPIVPNIRSWPIRFTYDYGSYRFGHIIAPSPAVIIIVIVPALARTSVVVIKRCPYLKRWKNGLNLKSQNPLRSISNCNRILTK